MTVKEIKEILADLPDNHEVVLSKDSEGNSFSPLANWSIGRYTPETTWRGEYDENVEGEEKVFEENAVVLWPTN